MIYGLADLIAHYEVNQTDMRGISPGEEVDAIRVGILVEPEKFEGYVNSLRTWYSRISPEIPEHEREAIVLENVAWLCASADIGDQATQTYLLYSQGQAPARYSHRAHHSCTPTPMLCPGQ
ncbi:MAG: hypothetical protein HGA85_06700 [Nanoarchaeota archaeon]|nr:hypothetical protein [Nanoarchaeota archaeon]